MRGWVGTGALALGVALITVNFAGFFVPITEHPVAARVHVHKNLSRPSYPAALQALSRIDTRLPAEQFIAMANQIVAARIVHHWPEPNEADPDTMHSFLENWYLAALQRAEAWLAKKGLAKVSIARGGRRDFRTILAKGVGLCDTTAIALVDFLQEKGIRAQILALGGHVVAYASVGDRNYIIDPDYAIIIQDVPAPPERSIAKILAAYRETGRPPDTLARLESIYATSPMKTYEIKRYQRNWKRLLDGSRIIKWAVPIVLLALGIVLWRRSPDHPRALPQGPDRASGRAA